MHFGVADYAAFNKARTVVIGGLNPDYPGDQWHFALSRMTVACRAYGLRPIDGPFGDFSDPDGYTAGAKRAAALGIDRIRLDERLRERGFGCFEGLTGEQCAEHHAEAWQRYLADRRNTPADAEPQAQVIERLLAALTAVARAANPAGHVLVVSHGAAIRTFVHAVTGTPPGPLANAALLQVSYGPSGFTSVTPE
jgi:hypothetical protein